MPNRKVVIIEDDAVISSAIAARLRADLFAVKEAADGVAGVSLCSVEHPDLVILDLMLPGLDGIEVCRRIQKDRPVPVLMLTARDDEADMLLGLAVGADDYMTKPFSMRELMARIQTILRRVERTEQSSNITIGAIEIDPRRRLVLRDGEVQHLTPTEFDLLFFLAAKQGTVVSREILLNEVWGYHDNAGERTVDSHVRAVRRKLGDAIIRTSHGVGYAIGVAT